MSLHVTMTMTTMTMLTIHHQNQHHHILPSDCGALVHLSRFIIIIDSSSYSSSSYPFFKLCSTCSLFIDSLSLSIRYHNHRRHHRPPRFPRRSTARPPLDRARPPLTRGGTLAEGSPADSLCFLKEMAGEPRRKVPPRSATRSLMFS